MALAVLLLLLALAPAMAQNVVRQGETTELGIEQKPGDTYKWELYSDSTVNFAQVPGDTSPGYAAFIGGSDGTPVSVLWKLPGIYFFKVTAVNASGCTNNLKIGKITVLEALPTAIIVADTAVCEGEKIELEVTLTGTGSWDFTYTDGTTEWEVKDVTTNRYMITIDPGPSITTEYWITNVKDKYGTNTTPSEKATQQINPLPEPSTIYHR